MSVVTALDENEHALSEARPRVTVSPYIYLDANATTAPLRKVTAAVLRTMRSGAGNPSSAHHSGAAARRLLEAARDQVCTLVGGADPESVVFLSGGTEANNCVIESFARAPQSSFIAATVEHSSVYEPLRTRCGDRVSWICVGPSGRIDPNDVRRAMLQVRPGSVLLIVQAVNSETGVLQPVSEIARTARETRPDCFIHLDAAQAIGRIPLDLETLGVDTLAFSGHKLHGPAGTGVLVDGSGRDIVRPLIIGGGQERGLRSGTPNVAGIVGLGVAVRLRADGFAAANAHMEHLRDAFETIVQDGLPGDVTVNGGDVPRVSNTSNLRFRSVDGMKLLANLDALGVMASQGSACSSGRPEPSRVLRSMGLSEEEAYSSLRFSFSILNTKAEARDAAAVVVAAVRKLAQ